MASRKPRFGIVASRFNRPITENLLKGALAALKDHGVASSRVDLVWVPGAFELPVAALRMARSGRYQAIVALGCILAGETPQYTYLSQATYQGLALAGVLSGVPITCGVITARRWAHALGRSKSDGLNRGREAAEAAWEMAPPPSGGGVAPSPGFGPSGPSRLRRDPPLAKKAAGGQSAKGGKAGEGVAHARP